METPEKQEESQTNQDVNKEGTEKEPEVDKYSDNEKQLYARAKNAEKEAKELKLKLKEIEDKTKAPEKKEEQKPQTIDAVKIAKLANSLKDYEDDELSFADILVKGKGISLEEAINTDEFKTYVGATRDKKQKDNMATTPNGKQPGYKKEDPFVKKFSQNLPKGYDYTK